MLPESAYTRIRPPTLPGFTTVAPTADGKVYVTINYDDDGIREVFAVVGRCGGTLASLAEAIGREISMLLQYGVPRAEITRCLIGIKSTGGTEGGYLSIPDAIGQILRDAPEALGSS